MSQNPRIDCGLCRLLNPRDEERQYAAAVTVVEGTALCAGHIPAVRRALVLPIDRTVDTFAFHLFTVTREDAAAAREAGA
ncbi:hypothetical protein [Pseudonocardia sp. NPDC049635]|uniref:hypothetical protein n=1 Tax=Pseudonocardia sp. NPDC049635 TaxID=3155506 RepID=UPI0033D37C55